MNDYEQERAERIAENQKRIEELGLQQAVSQMAPPAASTATQGRKRSRKQATPERQIRRSGRERKQVSYKEPEFELFGQGQAAARRRLTVNVEDEEELARLRAAISSTEAPDASTTPKLRKPVDSGKGVRIQGGKVYDSKYGVTCHWCRQKTLENHVTCTQENCGKGKRLPVTFCFSCLRNRHGEDGNLAHASKSWVCPPCRVHCGPGCIICCNCGPCRKKAGLEPTHQVVKLARAAGYDNVHDYLVHLARPNDTPEEILARKTKFPWGQWMVSQEGTQPEASEDVQGAQSGETSGEAEETHVTQEGSAPGTSSEGGEQPKRSTRGRKTLTEVYKVGKPRAGSTASKAKSKQTGDHAANDDGTGGGASATQDLAKNCEDNVNGNVAKTPNSEGLTRKQRIQMSLGLGAISVSA